MRKINTRTISSFTEVCKYSVFAHTSRQTTAHYAENIKVLAGITEGSANLGVLHHVSFAPNVNQR